MVNLISQVFDRFVLAVIKLLVTSYPLLYFLLSFAVLATFTIFVIYCSMTSWAEYSSSGLPLSGIWGKMTTTVKSSFSYTNKSKENEKGDRE